MAQGHAPCGCDRQGRPNRPTGSHERFGPADRHHPSDAAHDSGRRRDLPFAARSPAKGLTPAILARFCDHRERCFHPTASSAVSATCDFRPRQKVSLDPAVLARRGRPRAISWSSRLGEILPQPRVARNALRRRELLNRIPQSKLQLSCNLISRLFLRFDLAWTAKT